MPDEEKAMENIDLLSAFAAILESVLADGFSFPLYLVSVSANGQVIAVRYDTPGVAGKVLCEHIPEAYLRVPINIYISDGTGRAARAVLEAEGKEPRFIN
jgi:hypothetical protein